MKAGFSKVEITPDLHKMDVYGLGYWFERQIRFTAIRDPLFVRTLAWEVGESVCLIISVDIIFDCYGFTERASRRISESFNIPSDLILISCTHTHSSPMVGLNNTDQGSEYGVQVEEAIVKSAELALMKIQPVDVSWSQIQATGIVRNRRPVLKNGQVGVLHSDINNDEIIDPGPLNETMSGLIFKTDAGEILGILIHFGIHGVCIQCSDMISSDAMGRALQTFESSYSDKTSFMHINGPCGEIDPISMGGETELYETQKRLETAIANLLAQKVEPLKPEDVCGYRNVFLAKRRQTKNNEEIQELLTSFGQETSEQSQTHHEGIGYKKFLLDEQQKLSCCPVAVPVKFQIIKIGNIIFLAVSGELFTQFGYAICNQFPQYHVISTGMSGFWQGYFPPKEAFSRGGYETEASRWSRLEADQCEELLERLKQEINSLCLEEI